MIDWQRLPNGWLDGCERDSTCSTGGGREAQTRPTSSRVKDKNIVVPIPSKEGLGRFSAGRYCLNEYLASKYPEECSIAREAMIFKMNEVFLNQPHCKKYVEYRSGSDNKRAEGYLETCRARIQSSIVIAEEKALIVLSESKPELYREGRELNAFGYIRGHEDAGLIEDYIEIEK